VSPELAAAAKDVDLVVLEGMGRGIETNLYAALTVDKLNLGMIKHPEVRVLGCCQTEIDLEVDDTEKAHRKGMSKEKYPVPFFCTGEMTHTPVAVLATCAGGSE